MGVTIKKIRVKLSFKYHKAISFTKELVFFGSDKKKFSLFVSGTTDNSVISSMPFMLRTGLENFKLDYEEDVDKKP